jgi:hypothetical protein
MANVIYNKFKRDIADGNIDLDTDTIKVMLVISAYTPDQDAQDKRDDITNEVSGTSYTAGGKLAEPSPPLSPNPSNVLVPCYLRDNARCCYQVV